MSGQLTRVTENLREMIMKGSLAQGERIKEVALAHTLGVSRTPVRLALAILEKENLVEGQQVVDLKAWPHASVRNVD